MTLSEFKTIIRLMVSSATAKRIPDAQLEILINKGIRNVNNTAKVLIKESFFNAVADDGDYVISDDSNISDFILVGESGLWFNNGSVSSPYYRQLDGVTRAYLDEKHRNWQNASSGIPLYALFEPNLITVHPKPSSALTNGFLLPDYVYKPTTLANDAHYPFSGNATEYPALEVLDDAITDYVRWILGFSVGETNEGIITRQIYEKTLKISASLMRRRPDFNASRDFRMQA